MAAAGNLEYKANLRVEVGLFNICLNLEKISGAFSFAYFKRVCLFFGSPKISLKSNGLNPRFISASIPFAICFLKISFLSSNGISFNSLKVLFKLDNLNFFYFLDHSK